MAENASPTSPQGSPPGEPQDSPESAEESNTSRNILLIILVIVALLVCGALAYILLIVRPFAEPETPTLVPTVPGVEITPTISQPDGVVDAVWAGILERGTLRVGTSADYPPFEYYTENFQLDGFDIALIRTIADRLGLGIEIKDMAFDGLGNALQINQIDLAISAITVTPERDGFVDFSNTYFLSEDAVLTTDQSNITITAPEQIANYRLGVQSGTIYEQYAQTDLIEAGIMPENNLFVYQQMDTALEDLSLGRINLVAMDLAPAETAVSEGGYAIAGQGLNRERLAIAVPQGAFTLQDQLNKMLITLQNEGVVADLILTYFDLDETEIPPIPTPTPGPTATPAPPPACVDGMQWVADLNLDDQGMTSPPQLSPGEPFEKGWRVRNTGTCTWDSTYTLLPVGGNTPAARMGGVPTPVQGQVAPGQTYDFWVDLVAPLAPGVYQEFWTMRNPENLLFGDRIWVGVEVVPYPTATPPPTQTPSPSIQFSANPTSIQEGECSTLSWNTSNVQAVYLYPQGEDWRNYGVPGTGQRSVCPNETTTYELRVVKTDGSVEVRNATVFVSPAPGNPPQITRFTVEPAQINTNQCVAITWQVDNSNSRTIWRDNTAIWPNAPASGNMQDCLAAPGEYVYQLEASNASGISRQQQYVRVVQPATPIPTATPTTPPSTATPVPATPTPIPDPIIYSFTANPAQVTVGNQIRVSWNVGGGAQTVNIYKNGALALEDASFQDSVIDQATAAGTVTYAIEALNSAGGSATEQASVTVVEAAPDNPLLDTSWELVSYFDGTTEQPVLQGTTLTANFADDNDLSGTGGCNTYSATYLVDGAQIAISKLKSSKLTCGDQVDQQETTYLTLLPTAVTYAVNDQGQLTMSDEDGQVILTYAALVAVPLQ
ncbi:MAG: transporter substrate-binding domain-containing protein [Chloroflexota bacterium]|jgi:polar amino acid transport system substrate-binding protein